MSKHPARHYATDWVWFHSQVTGIVRYVFLAIAQCMKGGKCETPPTPVAELQALTGMGESTIRRSIKEIEQAGDLVIVKANRRGTVHQYALAREVRLPLDVDPPERPERAVSAPGASGERQGESPPGASSVSAQSGRSEQTGSPPRASGVSGHSGRSGQCSVGAVSASGALVQQASYSDLRTSNQELRTTTSTASKEREEVESFLTWFTAEYPAHRQGVHYAELPGDAAAVSGLLKARTVGRLQAMAIRMWAEREDWWVLNSDRSPRVLRRRASKYEAQVLAAERQSLTPFELARRAGLK